MSFLGSFNGSDARNDITNAHGQANQDLARGLGAANSYYDEAAGYFDPYSQTGTKANAMLGDALGLNGRGAYQGVVNNFASDPFRQSNEDFANQQLKANWNAYGDLGGNAMLAAARGSLERGSTDWNNWLNRLTGQQGVGLQAAGGQAGVRMGQAGTNYGAGVTQASNDISYGNAMAAAAAVPWQNTIGALGTVIKGFTPGFLGQTPFGNMGSLAMNGFGNAMKWGSGSSNGYTPDNGSDAYG